MVKSPQISIAYPFYHLIADRFCQPDDNIRDMGRQCQTGYD